VNGITSVCITKLDILDGLDEIKVCTSYKSNGDVRYTPPYAAEDFEACEPVYESMAGWSDATEGLTDYSALPQQTKSYLKFIEDYLQAPVKIISTGPERNQTIVLEHPFD